MTKKLHVPGAGSDSGKAAQGSARIVGEGELADLIRAFDWSAGPLGPIETWPDSLVTTVNLLLASRHPMFLWWGPDLIQFYNDGYRPSIRADKHPSAVGQRGVDCWPEIWPIIGPQIESVMTRGCSTWNINQLVPINRNGKLEEVYWTYSYSPVRDKNGTICGTLVVCSETTEQVLSERRLRALLAIALDATAESPLSPSESLAAFSRSIIRDLAQDPEDLPFAALYLSQQGKVFSAEGTKSIGPMASADFWPLSQAAQSDAPLLLEDLSDRSRHFSCPPWPEPVSRAYLLPLRLTGSPARAVLVLGISPRLPFDESYRTFFELVGARIAGLLQSQLHKMEVAQSALRFSTLVEANPFGMIIGGLHGELRYVNSAFLQVLGYSEEEVSSGRVRWDNLTPAEFAAADTDAVRQLRDTGQCAVYEKVFVAKDGRRIPILIGASVIEQAEGGKAEVAAFVTDLTALKIAEQSLQKANEELEKKVEQRTSALEMEVVERKRAEMSLRELTGRLLVTQDEERRYMARELHDHAGQILTVLAMNLADLAEDTKNLAPKVHQMAAQSQQLSDDLSREIRTLSYLLHPPLLDEAGLASALHWYADGFSQRSLIKVELDLPPDLGRFTKEVELAIFRVVQEGLTNIHRHSGSATARINLARSRESVKFEIIDWGKGISEDRRRELTTAKTGVGLRGMEERVRQLGGSLAINSDAGGTKVSVILPVPSSAKANPTFSSS